MLHRKFKSKSFMFFSFSPSSIFTLSKVSFVLLSDLKFLLIFPFVLSGSFYTQFPGYFSPVIRTSQHYRHFAVLSERFEGINGYSLFKNVFRSCTQKCVFSLQRTFFWYLVIRNQDQLMRRITLSSEHWMRNGKQKKEQFLFWSEANCSSCV